MHVCEPNFDFYDVFYMFRTTGFIFRKTVVHTSMVYFVYIQEDKQYNSGSKHV